MWDGALLVPETSGSQRAVAVTADTIQLGMPSAVLKELDATPTSDESRRRSHCELLGLPPVQSMLADSGRTLERHHRMTEVKHAANTENNDGEAKPTAYPARQSGMASVVSSGARAMQEWFREKINIAKDAMSNLAKHADGRPDATEEAHAGPHQHGASAAGEMLATTGGTTEPVTAGVYEAATAAAVAVPASEAENAISGEVLCGGVDTAPGPASPMITDVAPHAAALQGGRRVAFHTSSFPAARNGGNSRLADENDPGQMGRQHRIQGGAEDGDSAVRGCPDSAHVAMSTGVADISEPLLCFIASGYQVCMP